MGSIEGAVTFLYWTSVAFVLRDAVADHVVPDDKAFATKHLVVLDESLDNFIAVGVH